MNKTFLVLLVFSCSINAMQPGQISKNELLKLVEKQDAKSFLFALSHQGARAILDEEITQIAQEQHNLFLQKAARAQSILLMITKNTLPTSKSSVELSQPTPQDKELSPKEKTRTSSTKSHSSHHPSSQKNPETSPKKQLLHLIKKRDVEGVTQFMGTSGVHFVDNQIIAYAQSKYEPLLNSSSTNIDATSSKEYAILQLVKKNGPSQPKERRKSCIIKVSSPRDTKS